MDKQPCAQHQLRPQGDLKDREDQAAKKSSIKWHSRTKYSLGQEQMLDPSTWIKYQLLCAHDHADNVAQMLKIELVASQGHYACNSNLQLLSSWWDTGQETDGNNIFNLAFVHWTTWDILIDFLKKWPLTYGSIYDELRLTVVCVHLKYISSTILSTPTSSEEIRIIGRNAQNTRTCARNSN